MDYALNMLRSANPEQTMLHRSRNMGTMEDWLPYWNTHTHTHTHLVALCHGPPQDIGRDGGLVPVLELSEQHLPEDSRVSIHTV